MTDPNSYAKRQRRFFREHVLPVCEAVVIDKCFTCNGCKNPYFDATLLGLGGILAASEGFMGFGIWYWGYSGY